jgi:hypothetical protein
MQIDLLYFEDCPSWQAGLENLKAALAAEGVSAEIGMVRVENNTDAARLRFLGSPSFQINGQDLWPEDRQRYNLSCRVYTTPQGMKGAPTVEMLREKLRNMRLPLNTSQLPDR